MFHSIRFFLKIFWPFSKCQAKNLVLETLKQSHSRTLCFQIDFVTLAMDSATGKSKGFGFVQVSTTFYSRLRPITRPISLFVAD